MEEYVCHTVDLYGKTSKSFLFLGKLCLVLFEVLLYYGAVQSNKFNKTLIMHVILILSVRFLKERKNAKNKKNAGRTG